MVFDRLHQEIVVGSVIVRLDRKLSVVVAVGHNFLDVMGLYGGSSGTVSKYYHSGFCMAFEVLYGIR